MISLKKTLLNAIFRRNPLEINKQWRNPLVYGQDSITHLKKIIPMKCQNQGKNYPNNSISNNSISIREKISTNNRGCPLVKSGIIS